MRRHGFDVEEPAVVGTSTEGTSGFRCCFGCSQCVGDIATIPTQSCPSHEALCGVPSRAKHSLSLRFDAFLMDRGRAHSRTRGGQWCPLTFGRQAKHLAKPIKRASSAVLPRCFFTVHESMNADFLVFTVEQHGEGFSFNGYTFGQTYVQSSTYGFLSNPQGMS